MLLIGFCHTCDAQTQVLQTEPPTCHKCKSDFVEIFELENANEPSVDRPSLEQPEPKNPRLDVDTDITCPICFEEWTSGGAHHLVSLNCGHLFGESCISKWLRDSGKCALCNQVSRSSDIRRLFVKNIKVADYAEIEKEKKLRIEAEQKYEKLLKEIAAVRQSVLKGAPVFSEATLLK